MAPAKTGAFTGIGFPISAWPGAEEPAQLQSTCNLNRPAETISRFVRCIIGVEQAISCGRQATRYFTPI
jgi:hypothetical protein